MRPLIGILTSVLVVEDGLHSGSKRFFVSDDYVEAIIQAGGIPIILPVVEDKDAMRRQVETVDGILLPGGGDIDPWLYGEEPLPKLGTVDPERDEYEICVVNIAHKMGKPQLGICRGSQLINVAFGGTLYQDIMSQLPEPLQHRQESGRYVEGHMVRIVKESMLSEIFGVDCIRTNSYHHQAVKDVAPGFIVSAFTGDGVIEGIEKPGEAVLAVEWHPEMMFRRHPAMLKIFIWLVNEARIRMCL